MERVISEGVLRSKQRGGKSENREESQRKKNDRLPIVIAASPTNYSSSGPATMVAVRKAPSAFAPGQRSPSAEGKARGPGIVNEL